MTGWKSKRDRLQLLSDQVGLDAVPSANGRVIQARPIASPSSANEAYFELNVPADIDPASDVSDATTKFWQDEFEISSDGSQALPLTYLPKPNSEHVYWLPGGGAGLYWGGGEWSRNGWVITTAPKPYVRAGDKFIVEYSPESDLRYVPSIQFVGSNESSIAVSSLSIPGGSQAGDLMIVGVTGMLVASVADSRLRLLWSVGPFPGEVNRTINVYGGYLTADNLSAISMSSDGGTSYGSASIAVFRNVKLGPDQATIPPTTTQVNVVPQLGHAVDGVLAIKFCGIGTVSSTDPADEVTGAYTTRVSVSAGKSEHIISTWQASDHFQAPNPPGQLAVTNGTHRYSSTFAMEVVIT